jgi:hypothetical protein
LGGYHTHSTLFAVVEGPHVRTLQGEYPHPVYAAGNGHSQVGVVFLLVYAGHRLEGGVLAPLGDTDGTQLLESKTAKAFAQCKTQGADPVSPQALGRGKNQFAAFLVEEVDRTDLGRHVARHHGDDPVQERLDVLCAGEQPIQLAEIAEKLEMIGPGLALHGVSSHKRESRQVTAASSSCSEPSFTMM